MCVPQILDTTSTVTSGLMQVKSASDNYKYKSQIALNNAINAKQEGLIQAQTGIEEARKEKISGLSEANKLLAKNASSGFQIDSLTNKYNYQDIINTSNSNAKNTQEQYDLKADSYFNKAKSYLNQIDSYKKEYKSNLFKTGANALGSFGQVAESWYENNYPGEFIVYDHI